MGLQWSVRSTRAKWRKAKDLKGENVYVVMKVIVIRITVRKGSVRYINLYVQCIYIYITARNKKHM